MPSDELDLIVEDTKEKMEKSLEDLFRVMGQIRSGRATTALVDDIRVEVYGQPMPMNQVATVSVPEARLITVDVWDKANIQEVEKAIQKSGRNLNPQNDGSLIRINLPELTEERRREMVKLAKQKVEDHKVSIRNIRRDGNENIKKSSDGVSEDEIRAYQDDIQKVTDGYIKRMDEVFSNKENITCRTCNIVMLILGLFFFCLILL